MKKLNFLIISLAFISFFSCKKDYTCECKSIETENGNVTETVTETFGSEVKMSKKTALDWCKNYGGYNETAPDYEYKEECDIK